MVGGKVKGEFDSLCDRRYELYDDIVDFLENTGQEIYDYNAQRRGVHLSANDRDHLRRNLQWDWINKNEEEKLSILRRLVQEIELYKLDVLNIHIDDFFSQYTNNDLLNRLERDLDIGHDKDVIVDAIEIAREHSISILLAVDSDITATKHVETVCGITNDIFGSRDILRIEDADEL